MILERCVELVRSARDPANILRLLRATTTAEQYREILRAIKVEETKE